MKSTVLLGHSLRHRQNRYEHPALGFGTKLDATVDEREQGMVLGQAYIGARVPLGAALARDDVAGKHLLAAEHAETKAPKRKAAAKTQAKAAKKPSKTPAKKAGKPKSGGKGKKK